MARRSNRPPTTKHDFRLLAHVTEREYNAVVKTAARIGSSISRFLMYQLNTTPEFSIMHLLSLEEEPSAVTDVARRERNEFVPAWDAPNLPLEDLSISLRSERGGVDDKAMSKLVASVPQGTPAPPGAPSACIEALPEDDESEWLELEEKAE